jgi:glyoxylase-like metal-dependent hydrolase (beta-lactamase superfamily II)
VVVFTKKVFDNLFLIDLKTAGQDNLIASYVLKGEKAIIVDTGPTSSIPNLLLGLKNLNVEAEDVTYVALTHIHADHGGGVGLLLKSLPNAKVVVHSKGAPHLVDPSRLWEASKETLGDVAGIFGEPEAVLEEKIVVGSEGMVFDVGRGCRLGVVETPGHASHNLSYFEYLNGGVFPGDAAGAYVCEFDVVFPTTPPPFRPDIALASLDKLIGLGPKFLCYPHFGFSSGAVRRLREYKEQIGLWLRIAREGVSRGESFEAIQKRIFREDVNVRADVLLALEANPVQCKTLLVNSPLGFVDFAVKNQMLESGI